MKLHHLLNKKNVGRFSQTFRQTPSGQWTSWPPPVLRPNNPGRGGGGGGGRRRTTARAAQHEEAAVEEAAEIGAAAAANQGVADALEPGRRKGRSAVVSLDAGPGADKGRTKPVRFLPQIWTKLGPGLGKKYVRPGQLSTCGLLFEADTSILHHYFIS